MATVDVSPGLGRPIPLHTPRRHGRRSFGKIVLAAAGAGAAVTTMATPDKVADALDYIANAIDPDAEAKRPKGKYIKTDTNGNAILDAANRAQISEDQTIVDVDTYAPDALNNISGNNQVPVFNDPTDVNMGFQSAPFDAIKAHSGTVVFGDSYNSTEYGYRTVDFNNETKVGGFWFSPRDKAGNPVDAITGEPAKKPQYIKLANVRIKEKQPAK